MRRLTRSPLDPLPLPPARPRHAFTLVELLVVVVAVIAVLMAILLPSLGRAREQARIAKCSANQRTLAQAVHTFASEHGGYGQLLAGTHVRPHWEWTDSTRRKYAYESVGSSQRTVVRVSLAPWPIAYPPYIGAPGLRSADYFVLPTGVDPRTALDKTKVPVLRCPSDK